MRPEDISADYLKVIRFISRPAFVSAPPLQEDLPQEEFYPQFYKVMLLREGKYAQIKSLLSKQFAAALDFQRTVLVFETDEMAIRIKKIGPIFFVTHMQEKGEQRPGFIGLMGLTTVSPEALLNLGSELTLSLTTSSSAALSEQTFAADSPIPLFIRQPFELELGRLRQAAVLSNLKVIPQISSKAFPELTPAFPGIYIPPEFNREHPHLAAITKGINFAGKFGKGQSIRRQ